MLAPWRDDKVDLVVGMESRGFIFSAPMAYLLNAGLVPVRKLGKLPAETITVEYALEYGSNTLEIHRDAIQPGQRVLVVDDLLATGGTVRGHDRPRRAAAGRGRRPGLPRRARVPQGPRSAPGPAGRERRSLLSGITVSDATTDDPAGQGPLPGGAGAAAPRRGAVGTPGSPASPPCPRSTSAGGSSFASSRPR